MKITNTQATSFTEILITITIFTIIFGAILGSLDSGNMLGDNYDDNIAVQREVHKALLAMSKELREANNVSVLQDANNASINFSRPVIGNISFSWSTTGGNANRIIRQDPTSSRILANDISSLSFANTDLSVEVIINVTAAKTSLQGNSIDFTSTKKVMLR